MTTPTEPTPAQKLTEATLRVAVLKIRANVLEGQLKAARVTAQGLYALHRMAGNKQVTPVLPGGIEAGTLSINGGVTEVVWDDPALLALIEESDPANAEDYIPASALTDKRVIDLIREQIPDLVERRVNPARKTELAEVVTETGGILANIANGEMVKVATIHRHDPTGEFTYRPGTKGTAAVLKALKDGTVTEHGEVVPRQDGSAPDAG